jgi:FixJ family two-component response regulator
MDVPEELNAASRRRITIVDDDAATREALKSLMRSVQLDVDAFASAEEFLASERVHDTECLILDVCLPGMSGFELQERLREKSLTIPIVFITAHADELARQRALKDGAVDLLGKPVRHHSLFNAIRTAIQQ